MYRHSRPRVRRHKATIEHRIARGAAFTAGMTGANSALVLGTLGLGLLGRRYGRVHPLRLMRAAGRVAPELKGTLRIVRKVKKLSPSAFGPGMVRAESKTGQVLSQIRRNNMISIGRHLAGKSHYGHAGSGPILSHELGHLTDAGRRTLGGTKSLREEWRATRVGAKIHRAAGGNRVHYWGTTLPAFGTYLTAHPVAQIGAAALGAATARGRIIPTKQRRHRRRRIK